MSTWAEGASTASSSSARVSEELRRLIITGEILPGERIRARDIAERLDVSHIPVREAMRQLDGEGLIDYREQRGAVATDVSLTELHELYDIRRHIECSAARRAATTYDDLHLTRLAGALDALEEARSTDPHSETFFDAHHTFHWLLIGPGCTGLAQRILTDLWRAGDRYVHLGLDRKLDAKPGRHHRELYRAAAQRDGAGLADLVDEHLRITENAVAGRLPDLEQLAG